MKTVNLLIFEDVRDYLSLFVERMKRIDGVGLPYTKTVHGPYAAIWLFRKFRPEIVVTDMSLTQHARADGIDILNEIKRLSPETVVALATCYSPGSTDVTTETILRAGFDRVFNKGDTDAIARFVRKSAAKIRFG